MTSLLDQLTAVAAGMFVLVALLTLQTRDRVAAVDTAVTSAAQQQVTSVADGLAQEFDNALSERMATALLGTYRCRLTRDASGERTVAVEVPVFWRSTAGGAATPATVLYQLVSAGRTVSVGETTHAVYRLTRAVDTGSGYGPPKAVADNLIDFDVKFRGRASETFTGGPPLRFSQIAFHVVLAMPAPQALPGQRRTRQTNRARASMSVRPPNLISS